MNVKELYKEVMDLKIEDSNGNKIDYLNEFEKKAISIKRNKVTFAKILSYVALGTTIVSFMIICYLVAISDDNFSIPLSLGIPFSLGLFLTPFLFLIYIVINDGYKNLLINYYANIDKISEKNINGTTEIRKTEKTILINQNKNYYNYYKTYIPVIVAEIYVRQTGNVLKSYEPFLLSLIILQISVFQFLGDFSSSIALLAFFISFTVECIIYFQLIKNKKKKLNKFFYKIPNAYKQFNIIKFNGTTIDEFSKDNTLVFYGNPYTEFLNFLYNMFNNCHALKYQTINLYTLTVKDLSDKYHFNYSKMVGNKTSSDSCIFCIKMNDLIINDENINDLSLLKEKLNLQYFDDFAKYYM